MFFEYQLDEEIKEEIGIGFHSIEHCYVYMVVQQKERKNRCLGAKSSSERI